MAIKTSFVFDMSLEDQLLEDEQFNFDISASPPFE